MRLLAWPSGKRKVALGPADEGDAETAISKEAADTWRLEIRGRRTRSYDIEGWLGLLGDGSFRACNVRAIGALTPPRWTYDDGTGVVRIRVRGRRLRVLVRSC
jgi:hypothetical protein